jgi:hypothetical protein
MPTAQQQLGSEPAVEPPAPERTLRGARPSDLAVHSATERMQMSGTSQRARHAPPSDVNAQATSTSASEAVARAVAVLQAEERCVRGTPVQQAASDAECGEKLCSELDAELRPHKAERSQAVLLGNLQVLMSPGVAERIVHEGRIFSEAAYALETIEADVAEARAQLESMGVVSE